MNNLKKCPFCGGDVKEKPNGFIDWTCQCALIIHSSEWNIRPIEDEQLDAIQGLDKKCRQRDTTIAHLTDALRTIDNEWFITGLQRKFIRKVLAEVCDD